MTVELEHAFTVEERRVRFLLPPGYTHMAQWGRPEENRYVADRGAKGPIYATVVEIEYHRTVVGNEKQPEEPWRFMRASVTGEHWFNQVYQEWDEDKKGYVTTLGAWGQDTQTYYGSLMAAPPKPPQWLVELIEEHQPDA